MTLVALDGTPLVQIGAINRYGILGTATIGSVLLDAANEALITYGQVFTEDGASHTIDTTGSSSLGWRTTTVTNASGTTVVKVGLATMDLAAGPAARAVNVANVITFDVSKSISGIGALTANTWFEHVPDSGTKTVANGDFLAFAVQMTVLGGADLVNVGAIPPLQSANRPGVTSFLGGAYADAARMPNCVITFSDGVRGYFYGGHITSAATTLNWNASSGTIEYGNYMSLPFPVSVYGLTTHVGPNSATANWDMVLYSDPLGTPVAQKTVSIDANATAAATTLTTSVLFPTPYVTTANQPLAAIMKATVAAQNISTIYKSFNISAHQKSEFPGTAYAVNRSTGAFASQNSGKDRFAIGLLVGAFGDDSGGGGGGLAARLVGGFHG